jgi:hypothetical protein
MLKLFSLSSSYTNTTFEKKNWINLALKGNILLFYYTHIYPPECGISQSPVIQNYKYQCQIFSYFALKFETARFYEMSTNKSITTLCYHPRKKTRLAASHHKPSGT